MDDCDYELRLNLLPYFTSQSCLTTTKSTLGHHGRFQDGNDSVP